jgi:hypothetical protein
MVSRAFASAVTLDEYADPAAVDRLIHRFIVSEVSAVVEAVRVSSAPLRKFAWSRISAFIWVEVSVLAAHVIGVVQLDTGSP